MQLEAEQHDDCISSSSGRHRSTVLREPASQKPRREQINQTKQSCHTVFAWRRRADSILSVLALETLRSHLFVFVLFFLKSFLALRSAHVLLASCCLDNAEARSFLNAASRWASSLTAFVDAERISRGTLFFHVTRAKSQPRSHE